MKPSRILPIPSLLAAFLSATPCLTAGTTDAAAPAVEPAKPPLKLNMLLQLDISDHYITPRGLNVENDGAIFQPLFLLFANL